MKVIITIVILISIIDSTKASVPTCSSNINCISYPNAHCQEGYCVCNSGYSFNCSTASTFLPTGSASLSMLPNSINYYVLDGILGTQVDYDMTISDSNNSNMISDYRLSVFIDDGVGQKQESQPGQLWNYGNEIHVKFTITLQKIQNTDLPQSLVFNITYVGSSPSTLSLEYSTSTSSSSDILLILSYACGGFLVLVTLILIIIILRKRREQEEQRGERSANRRSDKLDISHFDIYMPALPISQKDRQEGKTCSVCLLQFQPNIRARSTPCGHLFHKDCLDQWCLKNMSCPNCRTDFSPENLNELRAQKARRDDSSWIVNSIALEQESESESDDPSTKRQMQEPLYHGINNTQL